MKFAYLFLLLFACTSHHTEIPRLTEETRSTIQREIEKLSNSEELRVYLENIYSLDQSVRSEAARIEMKEGYGTDERIRAGWKMLNTDLENLYKISLILEKFGYPNIDSVGPVASRTVLLVIHHSPNDSARMKYFPVLYQAYVNGQVDDGLFSFYLERMYRMRFDKRFDMPAGKPYRIKQEIDTLIQILELVSNEPVN